MTGRRLSPTPARPAPVALRALASLVAACSLLAAGPVSASQVIDFDSDPSGPHANGTPLGSGYDLGSATLDWGEVPSGSSLGPVVFDSDPNGPVQNRIPPAVNLLVDLGNILTFQDGRYFERLEDGRFLYPTQSRYGGVFVFQFHEKVTPLSIDLIDIDTGGQHAGDWDIVLANPSGAQRIYRVPSGFSSSPGYRTLDLTSMQPQEGQGSVFSHVAQDAGYEPTHVTLLEIVVRGSGAIDNVTFNSFMAEAPAPGALSTLGLGLLGLALARRRRR